MTATNRDILDFLAELSLNNNREWFQSQRPRYEACKKRFEELTREYIERLSELDPLLKPLQPKDCIWRINRDIRFSADKRPYKEWFGAFPAQPLPGKPSSSGGKKSDRGGYYMHFQPGNCMFAAGIWGPTPELLTALRKEIEANYEEVESIMSTPEWHQYFGDFDTDWMLKRVPAGFDPNFIHADWLKRKCYTVSRHLTDDEVCQPDFMDLMIDLARTAKPINDFLNYTFEEYDMVL